MGVESGGHFIGDLVITPVGDGVHWDLLEDYGFEDKRTVRWMVPRETRVDGASIPKALWSLVGSPFTGKYVQASVIHDYFCDIRSRNWKEVHRVFYEAMLVSGVSEKRAKVMYAAVYFAGPRWSETVVHNSNLDRLFSVHASKFAKGLSDIVAANGVSVRERRDSDDFGKISQVELDLEGLEQLIGECDPSMREIGEGLDAALTLGSESEIDRQLLVTGDLAEWLAAGG